MMKTEIQSSPIDKRVEGLDLLRGIALLGILLANVHQMLSPWDLAGKPIAIVPGEWGTYFEWFFVSTFVDNKFLTVFSLLFGMGFAIQVSNLQARAGKFRWIYSRRLLLLALMGIGHGIYLYSADVLFYYAMTGFVLMFFWGLSARLLMVLGYGLLVAVLYWTYFLEVALSQQLSLALPVIASIVIVICLFRKNSPLQIGFSGLLIFILAVAFTNTRIPVPVSEPGEWAFLQSASDRLAAMPEAAIVIGGDTFSVPLEEDSLAALGEAELGAIDFMALEITAMRHGPASLTEETRLNRFLNMQFAFILYFFWRTLAVFLFGAGLVKWGLLQRDSSSLYRNTVRWGIGLGLPLSALATTLVFIGENQASVLKPWAGLLQELSAYPLALGIASLVMVWSKSDVLPGLRNALATAGRMALSNYIGQSAVMAYLATWYGQGLFGTLGRVEQLGLAVGVFAVLLMSSRLWFLVFRMGPLEWLWRLGTYLKPAPILK